MQVKFAENGAKRRFFAFLEPNLGSVLFIAEKYDEIRPALPAAGVAGAVPGGLGGAGLEPPDADMGRFAPAWWRWRLRFRGWLSLRVGLGGRRVGLPPGGIVAEES